MSRLYGEIQKKIHMIFLSYYPLKILKFDGAILQMQYLKKYKTKDLKPVLADKE